MIFRAPRLMLKRMRELDEMWGQLLAEAARRAGSDGRSDVAEYLSLKSVNDQLRAAGCRWLFDSCVEVSEEYNRRGIRFETENFNPHRFQVGAATMVGSVLKFHRGVRNFSVEAGWTRAPGDGFMPNASLARARLSHFGMSKVNAELALIRHGGDAPEWRIIALSGKHETFSSNILREHFRIFADAG